MLPDLMPPPQKKTPAQPGERQLNIRASADLLDKLDAWLADLNEGRRLPLTRSDLIRGLLDWGADHRPDWERG